MSDNSTDQMQFFNDSNLWQLSNSSTWTSIFTGIERGLTCFGILCNFILLPLIFFKSPTDMGVYKFLMIYVAVFELFFGWLELMTMTKLYTQGSLFTVVVDPDQSLLPDGLLQISCLIYCGSFSTSLAIFGVQFAYRYLVLKGNTSLTSKRLFTFLFWGCIPLVVALLLTLACSIYLGRNEYMDYAISQKSYPISLENKTVGFAGVYYYPELPNGSTTINWDSFIGNSLCTCILFISEFIMLYFAVKSYTVTKSSMNSATFSAHFQKLQWQLFYALVSQAIIPIFCMQVPLSLIHVTLLANVSTPIFGQLQALTIPLYLATDALPTIFIIKPYREFIYDCHRCLKFCCCKTGNSASQVGTITSILPVG